MVIKLKITVGVSKRHVHLTKKVCQDLFGTSDLPERNPLNQPGQYASTYTVDLKNGEEIITHVRVVGPLRKYNQIELAPSEAKELHLNPPTRKSGDLNKTPGITLIGPKGEVKLDSGVIISEKHVHMTPIKAKEIGLKDEEVVAIYRGRKELFKAHIKIQNPAFIELHIDTDDEIEYDLHQGDEVEVYKCNN
jgi:propanediol utilization protein